MRPERITGGESRLIPQRLEDRTLLSGNVTATLTTAGNLLVVGDAIIDEYQYVTPLGKSPKENMIAALYLLRYFLSKDRLHYEYFRWALKA